MTDDELDRRLNPFRYDGTGNLTDSARRQDRSLRLDSYDGGHAAVTGPPALTVSASLLDERAADTDAVAKEFRRACRAPLSSTREVAGGLKGFRCAGAFAVFEARWQAETRYVETHLLATFAQDLRSGAKAYADRNQETADSFGT